MMSQYSIGLAGIKDDEQLNKVLASNILEGKIAISFRKSPSFFTASNINGYLKQIIKCTHLSSNNIVGMGSRFSYPAFINGQRVDIGYLSDLRIDPKHRNGHLLAKGYRFLEALHNQHPLTCYLTMIYDKNEVTLRTIAAHRANLPRYINLGQFLTPTIFLDLPKRKIRIPRVSFTTANDSNINEVFAFLQKTHRQKQFAPYYTASDLLNGRLQCLKHDDIYLAIKDNRIIGMAATWDQSTFRQVIVEKYNETLGLLYPFYNMLTNITPLKPLPNPGTAIHFFYLALIAIEKNDINVFRALLRHIYRDRVKGPWNYFITGLHVKDPLAKVLSEYRAIKSYGNLFYIDYHNTLTLDDRVPYIECSTL